MTPEEEKEQADRLEKDIEDRKNLDEDELKELAEKIREANDKSKNGSSKECDER